MVQRSLQASTLSIRKKSEKGLQAEEWTQNIYMMKLKLETHIWEIFQANQLSGIFSLKFAFIGPRLAEIANLPSESQPIRKRNRTTAGDLLVFGAKVRAHRH